MSLVRWYFGRRRFLIALLSFPILLILKRISNSFGIMFRTGSAMGSDNMLESPANRSPKGIVVYYSATGNTGMIAGAIYSGMKSVMPCDVAPFEKITPKEVAKYDVIAIGGPVWHFRESANLRLFIYNMPSLTGKLGVMFCTHGANPLSMFHNVEKSLRKKEAIVIGWNDWYGKSELSLHSPKPAPTDGHPDDIDLKEAEVFGRETAERALRIFAGERNLIPLIPTGPDVDDLWTVNFGNNIGAAAGREYTAVPSVDTVRCVYPRCTACMDNCVANAIDLSKATTASNLSGASITVAGCLHCGLALCIRSCAYDAISYEQSRQNHVVNMEKCIYPNCTLCIDYCPMHCVDFTENPPVFHNNCEGCDVCYSLCPTRAVEITNFAETHGVMGDHSNDQDATVYKGFYSRLNAAKASGKFRPYVTVNEIGWNTPLSTFVDKRIPFFVRNDDDFPYHIGS